MAPSAIRQSDIAASFGAAATEYDAAASLQRRVCAMLADFSDLSSMNAERILDLGCGTGASQQRLGQAFSGADLLGMDLAEGMLREAKKQHPQSGWLAGSASSIPLSAECLDLIYANLCLQWCSDLQQVFGECRRTLKPGGQLSFSTLGPATLHELKDAWACADDQTHVNEFATVMEICEALQNIGLRVLRMEQVTLLEEHRDAISLCRNLKAIGAHNMNAGRSTGLVGRRKFRAMTDAYEAHRLDNGMLPASWDVVLVVAGR